MPRDLLHEARLYLVNAVKGKQNSGETRHPWRKGWEFAVLHSLRVEAYVLKILAGELHALSDHEIFLLRLAAILHDVARLDLRQGHAQQGAAIAEQWLERHTPGLDGKDVKRIVELIADHSNKEVHEEDFSKAVLKDADTLDEIGAMSIFMSANWLEPRSPFFFDDLRQRLIEAELPFCDKKMAILNTQGARAILGEKKAFIERFISQLTDELQGEAAIGQLLRGLL